MRCLACNRSLTDYEATRKCFKTVQADSHLPTKDRKDLISSDDIDDSVEDENDDCHVGDTNSEGDH